MGEKNISLGFHNHSFIPGADGPINCVWEAKDEMAVRP